MPCAACGNSASRSFSSHYKKQYSPLAAYRSSKYVKISVPLKVNNKRTFRRMSFTRR